MKNSKVIAIHDISGFGRCSLSVILPILSAMGLQTIPVPTACLSTHTGGLGDVAVRDLTDFLVPTLDHYKNLGFPVDCVYTGYLNSEEQIDICKEYFGTYPDAFKVVDPVMGDHGKVYKAITPGIIKDMSQLVASADLITPNITESYILTGREYSTRSFTVQELRSTLSRLAELGPKNVVMTGVPMADGTMINAGYDKTRSKYWKVVCKYLPVSYPGTGDIYASILVGAMISGSSLPMAMEKATRFLELAIKTTFSYGSDTRYGVMFEGCLPFLREDYLEEGYEIL